MSTACLSGAIIKPRDGIQKVHNNLVISETVFRWNEWHVVQLLAASACRGQFSSSMPESYSSSADSLAGALKFKWKLQFRFQTTQRWRLSALGLRNGIFNMTHTSPCRVRREMLTWCIWVVIFLGRHLCPAQQPWCQSVAPQTWALEGAFPIKKKRGNV